MVPMAVPFKDYEALPANQRSGKIVVDATPRLGEYRIYCYVHDSDGYLIEVGQAVRVLERVRG
jgi:hypothetical protein